MTPLDFLLYLILFFGRIAQMTYLKSSIYVQQQSGIYQAKVGDTVTLQCFYEGKAVMYYWYKQIVGQKPRQISSFYKRESKGAFLNEFKNDSRFTLTVGNGSNHLTISDLHISDSATYYCIGCYVYDFEFSEGIVVSVKDSDFSISALVHQTDSENVQPGDSLTLNCTVQTGTCDGEHSVYWFKDFKEPHPGIIYTHGDRNDQCEIKPEKQTHSCVYNLPMTGVNPSHAGTYHCAIASCGHILFGNRKKLDSGSADGHLVLVYLLSGALAFTIILSVLLAYAVYSMNNKNDCPHLPDFQARSSAASTPNAEASHDSDNLQYTALRKHKLNRPTRQMDETQSQCVYSSVKS